MSLSMETEKGSLPKVTADVDKFTSVLEPATSVDEATFQDVDPDRNGQFHRSFSPRQVHVSKLPDSLSSSLTD